MIFLLIFPVILFFHVQKKLLMGTIKQAARLESKWEGNPIHYHELIMILDFSEKVLNQKFPNGPVTNEMIVNFALVIAQRMPDAKSAL